MGQNGTLSSVLFEKTGINVSNKTLSWSQLYDSYAAPMYGIVRQLTSDEKMAEVIFEKAFLELKDRQKTNQINGCLCAFLMRFTYNFTEQFLKNRGIKPIETIQSQEHNLFYLLFTQCGSLKEAANFLNISDNEAKQNLQLCFSQLRRQISCGF